MHNNGKTHLKKVFKNKFYLLVIRTGYILAVYNSSVISCMPVFCFRYLRGEQDQLITPLGGTKIVSITIIGKFTVWTDEMTCFDNHYFKLKSKNNFQYLPISLKYFMKREILC